MPHILIYSAQHSNRLRYLCHFFSEYFGQTWQSTQDPEAYRGGTGGKINYSNSRILEEEIFLSPSGLLFEKGVRQQDISVRRDWVWPYFFAQTPDEASMPFDLLSAIFYLLSRYEEFLPFEPDRLGRFPARLSLAAREGFLHLPLVDLWLGELRRLIQQKYPQLPFGRSVFSILGTYDIDQAWAYLHKGWKRTLGGLARAILQARLAEWGERLSVLAGFRPDPFDVYASLESKHASFGVPAKFFFPVGPNGPLDKNHQPSDPHYRKLIYSLAQRHEVGLHPSFQSNQDARLLEKEKHTLEQIIHAPVSDSRQHYLMLRFPHTYRTLEKAGIKRDFTMGYPDAIGFRAGIARPFCWYDLAEERISALEVAPFMVMDVSMAQYQQLTPEAGWIQTKQLLEQTQAVNGQFCYIWHNSSFHVSAHWQGWEKVLWQILATGK